MAFTTYDNAPYLYRKSGGGGDKEIDKLVGGTIAWNQLTISSDNAERVTKYGITCTKAGGAVGEWTFSGTSEAVSSDPNFYASIKGVTVEANHVYLVRSKSSWFGMYCYGAVVGSLTQLEYMVKATNRGTEYFTFRPYRNLPVGTVINEVVRPQFHDLTLMFGSTIAGYVYSLEQSSQGSGLAWLRSYGFFTEDYYDYNSGELKSVSNLVSHDMTGEDASTTLHSYPLGDVTLRGLPKLNGNALYYDGDSYESNGTVTRKYGIVDLGSLTWSYDPAYNRFTTLGIANLIRDDGSRSTAMLCSAFRVLQNGEAFDINLDGVIYKGGADNTILVQDHRYTVASDFKTAMNGVELLYPLATSTTETADTYTNPQWVDPNGTERYTLSSNAFPMPVGHETTYNTDMGSKTVNTQVNLSMTEPQVRQVYAKEGDTARVLNIHLDQTEEDGTLRILRPDGTEVTADAVLVPEFYDGLMAEIPSDATSVVGKCYCDVEQNGVSSMPFTLNVKKNERAT